MEKVPAIGQRSTRTDRVRGVIGSASYAITLLERSPSPLPLTLIPVRANVS